MKKNKSLGCTLCKSSDIEYSIEFCNEKTKVIEDEGIKIITRQKVHNCNCNNCGHNYIVNNGNEKYVIFEKPYAINCSGDIKLLATFETESAFEKNYKICSITYSPYDEYCCLKEITYMMLIEGEEFPVIIAKHTAQEIIKNPYKAHKLVLNTIQSRHR